MAAATMRMEQWAELAPLTTQERDSISRLATALSEAATASLVFRPQHSQVNGGTAQGAPGNTSASGREAEAAQDASHTVASGPAIVRDASPGATATSQGTGSTGPQGHNPSTAQGQSQVTDPSTITAGATVSPHLPDFTSWLHPLSTTSTTTQGRTLQASQSASIEALHTLLHTLEAQILDEHLLRGNVNVAELRAGVRSVEETLDELAGRAEGHALQGTDGSKPTARPSNVLR